MRIIEKKVYTIDELKEMNKEAYEKAINNVHDRMASNFMNFDSDEIMDTLNKIAEHFYMDIVDYEWGLWERPYLNIDTDGYMELDNGTKNGLVQWLRDNLEEGIKGRCPFTGVFWDCYFFDEVKKLAEASPEGKISFNNLHKIVPTAMYDMLARIIDETEDTLMSTQHAHEYANHNELEFFEDGEIF